MTERDVEIVRAVSRVDVFTSDQLADAFFETSKRGLVRLRQLWELGVLDRFRPYREGWGSAPYHYVLGREGVAMATAWAGEDVDRAVRRYRGAFGLALARSGVLARRVAVSGFYASLMAAQRTNPACRLLDWMRPEEVERWTHHIIKDAWFGEWQHESGVEQFFVVADTGRLDRYDRFEQERGEHAHIILVTAAQGDRIKVLRGQRLHEKTQEEPASALHNCYRVCSPGADAHALFDGGDTVCPSPGTARAWLYGRKPLTAASRASGIGPRRPE